MHHKHQTDCLQTFIKKLLSTNINNDIRPNNYNTSVRHNSEHIRVTTWKINYFWVDLYLNLKGHLCRGIVGWSVCLKLWVLRVYFTDVCSDHACTFLCRFWESLLDSQQAAAAKYSVVTDQAKWDNNQGPWRWSFWLVKMMGLWNDEVLLTSVNT